MKKKIVFASILTAVLLTGCGSSNYTTGAYAVNGYAEDSMVESSTAYSGVSEYKKEENMQSDYLEQTERKLIKTVRISAETEQYDDFMTEVSYKINELGGYAQEMSESGQKGYRYASITARIPKNQLDAFLNVVSENTNVTYRSEAVEDVTLQYVDLESHKKMLKTEESRLLELLEKAETVDDIIIIESELTDVRYQIESMESQLRTFNNQIDFSTVYLNVDEVVRYTPQEELNVWGRIRTGFMDNLYDLGDGLQDIFVYIVIHIPNIILLAFMICIVLLVIKKVKKKK